MDVAGRFREYVRLDRKRRGAGLTPRELVQWRALKRGLSQHFTPGLSNAHADQRDSVRVPTRLRVSFASDGDLADCLLTNLSRKGVFIETDHPSEIGTRLDLRVHVDRPSRDIVLPVEVISHGLGPRGDARSGMGLRILDLAPDAEKELEDLYERLVR